MQPSRLDRARGTSYGDKYRQDYGMLALAIMMASGTHGGVSEIFNSFIQPARVD